jgi:hypothetical protein
VSLTDLHCCKGIVSVECNDCPASPRYITRQDIEIEHKHRAAAAAVVGVQFERTAKRILAEGAQSALTMVEAGLAAGLSPADAIAVAREGLDVWEPAA